LPAIRKDLDVQTISASDAATGRGVPRAPSRARIARTGLSCVARDIGIGVVQVVPAGRLDIGTALQANRAVRVAQGGAHLVILDLRQVEFIGCTAARVAVMADARARRIGGRLVVIAARAPASRPFALARLHRRLEIVEQFPRTTFQEEPV
jgi:anti-anti-sigma factor